MEAEQEAIVLSFNEVSGVLCVEWPEGEDRRQLLLKLTQFQESELFLRLAHRMIYRLSE
jgi:hypothetical protein